MYARGDIKNRTNGKLAENFILFENNINTFIDMNCPNEFCYTYHLIIHRCYIYIFRITVTSLKQENFTYSQAKKSKVNISVKLCENC